MEETEHVAIDIKVSWQGENIVFQWPKTDGIRQYILQVRNVSKREHLVVDREWKTNSYRRKMDDDLRYGQTYEMKLEITGSRGTIRRTHWQTVTIGGEEVPVNPKARLNPQKPRRSVVVEWREPIRKPNFYEVDAKPFEGKVKTQTSKRNDIIFYNLKSNTRYHFLVRAMYNSAKGVVKSPGCKTNLINTDAKPSSVLSTQYSNITSSKIQISNPTSVHSSHITNVRQEDFGKPRNVDMVIKTNKEGMEMAFVKWEAPTFCGESDDYEILEYDVKVKQDGKHCVFHDHFRDTTCTEQFLVNLGRYYTVHIKTKFEEIDAEKLQIVDYKEDFYTRPTKPKVSIKEESNNILFMWPGVLGADGYKVQVCDSNSETAVLPVYDNEGGKSFTSCNIDSRHYSAGRYYIFKVIASGKGSSSTEASVRRLIGGDRIPKMAVATSNKQSPYDSVIIAWERPHSKPKSYKVQAACYPEICATVDDLQCTMSGLRSGCDYQFDVCAIYDDGSMSNACRSNYICTDPKPSRVDNLQVKTDKEHPDKCVCVEWEPDSRATGYRVKAYCKGALREHYTEKTSFYFDGLIPNTKYKISVAAGNESGYGQESGADICTGVEKPQDLIVEFMEGGLVARCHHSGKKSAWKIYQREGDIFIEENITNDCNYCRFGKVNSNTEYYVTVHAEESELRSAIAMSEIVLTTPPVPEIKEIRVCEEHPSTDLYLQWTTGFKNLDYEVEVETDNEIERIFRVSSTEECKYRCFREGNRYSVRVRAKNKSGVGEWSSIKDILLAPPKVENLSVTSASGCLAVSWDKLKCHVAYHVLKIRCGEQEALQQRVEGTKYTLNEVIPGSIYCFSVAAFNTDDLAGLPVVVTRSIEELSPPSYILARKDEENPWTTVHFAWDRPLGAVSFIVGCNSFGTFEITENKCCIDKAVPGVECRIQVFSKNGEITSKTGRTSRILTEDLPKVTDVLWELDAEQPWNIVHLSWERPIGVQCFKIDERLSGTSTRTTENSFQLQNKSANRRMLVEIYSGKENVFCYTPASVNIEMAPLSWVSTESVNVEFDDETPWNLAHIKWDLPLGMKWSRVEIYCRLPQCEVQVTSSPSYRVVYGAQRTTTVPQNRCVVNVQIQESSFSFKRQLSCSTYEVKIYAGINPNSFAVQAAVKSVDFADLPEISPESLNVCLDEDTPANLAHIKWNLPDKMQWSKIEIYPMQARQPVLTEILQQNYTSFRRIGGVYSFDVKIYSGVGREWFATQAASKTFVMGPCDPEVHIREDGGKNPGIDVENRAPNKCDEIEITVVSEGQESVHCLPFNVRSKTICDFKPGEALKVYARAMLGTRSTQKKFIKEYQTRPADVVGLSVSPQNRDGLKLKWKPPKVEVSQFRVILQESGPSSGLLHEMRRGISTRAILKDIRCPGNSAGYEFSDLRPSFHYQVRISAGVGEYFGNESHQVCTTAALSRVSTESVNVEFDDETPWNLAHIKWDLPSGMKWSRVEIYCQLPQSAVTPPQLQRRLVAQRTPTVPQNRCVVNEQIQESSFSFKRQLACPTYEVKIYAGVNPNFFAAKAAVKSVVFADLPAVLPECLDVSLDEDNPANLAHIKWNLPDKLQWSKIEIYPTEERQPVHTEILQRNYTSFRRVGVGYTFDVKIYSGVERECLSTEAALKTFVMGPCDPEVHIREVCGKNPGIDVENRAPNKRDEIELTVESEGQENVHCLPFNVRSKQISDFQPGKVLKVYARAMLGTRKTQKKFIGEYQTKPADVEGLSVSPHNRNGLKLIWQPPKVEVSQFRIILEQRGLASGALQLEVRGGISTDTISNDVLCPGNATEYQFSELRPSCIYHVRISAGVGEFFGNESRQVCPTGWKDEEIHKEFLQKLAENIQREKIEHCPLLTPALSTDGGPPTGISNFLQNNEGRICLISGGRMSGKSTICRILCWESSPKKLAMWLDTKKHAELEESSLLTLLSNQYGLNLSEHEKTSYLSWLKANNDKICYIIDGISTADVIVNERPHLLGRRVPEKTSLIPAILRRQTFKNSSVFCTTSEPSISNRLAMSVRCEICHHSTESISEYLKPIDHEIEKLWNLVLMHSPDLCSSSRHQLAVLNLVRSNNPMTLSSPALVYAGVYYAILDDSQVDSQVVRKVNSLTTDITQCRQSGLLLGFDDIDVSSMNTHDKFVFAMYAIFFSPHVQSLVNLLKHCDDTKFLLLCAGCTCQQNLNAIFRLFSPNQIPQLLTAVNSKILHLEQQQASFLPKLGRNFFQDFLTAMKRKNLTKKFFPEDS